MTLMALLKSTVRLFYHLTVGLTVLLLQIGLFYLICFLILAAWITLVGMVTWKTYTATEHHYGWTACAFGLTVLLCGVLTVAVHRVARDWLGLTTLSLSQLFSLVFLRRRPCPQTPAGDGDGTQQAGRPTVAGEAVHVQTRRRITVGGTSSAEFQTRTTVSGRTYSTWR